MQKRVQLLHRIDTIFQRLREEIQQFQRYWKKKHPVLNDDQRFIKEKMDIMERASYKPEIIQEICPLLGVMPFWQKSQRTPALEKSTEMWYTVRNFKALMITVKYQIEEFEFALVETNIETLHSDINEFTNQLRTPDLNEFDDQLGYTDYIPKPEPYKPVPACYRQSCLYL